MSLPAELRVLCLQLSSTQPEDLPRLTPTLLRHVLRCQSSLSCVSSNSGKADASATAVQVHKLKTQLSTLLNGRSPEGGFTAVVLIKAVVEVGGWEVLRTAEPWVRGILAILGKPIDSVATKELCIVALTKIYCMTHPYQSLVREMTTPTLPTFIAACLNLASTKTSGKVQDVPSSLIETIFRCFTTLMPRHTTIFRPFTSQIRIVTRSYLAPTMSDGIIVSSSVVDSARSLVVALHQTVAKNGGGEEWGKSVRELVKDIHATADLVFRAVIEDWESTSGHISQNVDVNQELSGGDITSDTLPRWEGITAGGERLVGLIGLLEEYFKSETSSAVVVPIGSIIDMAMRMLWIVMPSSGTERGGARLHPAIDRDERDGLWSGLPQIYAAALQLIGTIVDRLGVNFSSMASGILDHITWILPSGKSIPEFRQKVYILVSKLLPMLDGSISKSGVGKLSPLIRCCCKDLQHLQPGSTTKENLPIMGDRSGKSNGKNPNSNGANSNADSFLQSGVVSPMAIQLDDPALTAAAETLLPLFLSHLPQQFIDLSVRALIERTAILTHHQDAMVASVINPFIGKDGNATPSILPHLARTYPNEDVVEVLLRPRMAVLPSASTRFAEVDLQEEEPMMDAPLELIVESMQTDDHDAALNSINTETKQNTLSAQQQLWGVPSATTLPSTGERSNATVTHSIPTQAQATSAPAPLETGDVEMDDSDSDDESVHMTGQLDDLSEDDSS